jgi:hypothetical protein
MGGLFLAKIFTIKKDGRRCTPASFWGRERRKRAIVFIKYAQMNGIINPLDLPML